MRLSDKSRAIIKECVAAEFPNSRTILFGSRADDAKRGGDIDLLVIYNGDADSFLPQIRAISKMQLLLGEQKIDMITTNDPNDNRPIVKIAMQTGVEL